MNRENQSDDILFDLLKTAGDLSKEAAPSWKQKMLAPALGLGMALAPGAAQAQPKGDVDKDCGAVVEMAKDFAKGIPLSDAAQREFLTKNLQCLSDGTFTTPEDARKMKDYEAVINGLMDEAISKAKNKSQPQPKKPPSEAAKKEREREQKCKADTARDPFTRSPYCEYSEGAKFPDEK